MRRGRKAAVLKPEVRCYAGWAKIELTRERRQLTEAELFVLSLIQEAYGFENTEDEVFFSDQDEAVIFVKGDSGSLGLAVLTNLADFLVDGTIASVEELKREWLMVDDT